MNNTIMFRELQDILVATGLTINGLHKLTKVSRNTLAAMRDGEPVTPHSVIKLLNGLESTGKIDVRDFRAILQRKMSLEREEKLAANGPPALSIVESFGSRTSLSIAADLREKMKDCAELASELAEAASAGDHDISADDPRHIERFHKRLNADLEEIYFQFRNEAESEPEKPKG